MKKIKFMQNETVSFDKIEDVTKELFGSNDYRIVVLQRGWVFVGAFVRIGNNCYLSDAYCIRRWGTTKGLGELVSGPFANTILDKCNGLIEFDCLSMIYSLGVNAEKWKTK